MDTTDLDKLKAFNHGDPRTPLRTRVQSYRIQRASLLPAIP